MITIQARNVNDALWMGTRMLYQQGVEGPSRNGPVLVAPTPVTTCYERPTERVMLHPGRDANPFFHLVEALWMIAGRNDLAALTPYVKTFGNYSDDGKTVPGAYGWRWRNHFDADQLPWAIRRLKDDPTDRRTVIQMYDANVDQFAADNGGKDIPCNLIALPSIGIDGKLNLTVFNRSNDMVWGAYGANAVHFSVLQEYLAAMIGVPVGFYWQVSNNFHAYTATLGKAATVWPWTHIPQGVDQGKPIEMAPDPYGQGLIRSFDMFEGQKQEEVKDDINMFFEDPARVGIRSGFLRRIACPMVMAHRAYKRTPGETGIAVGREIIRQMPDNCDWRAGAELWFNNRARALRKAQDDGVSHAD